MSLKRKIAGSVLSVALLAAIVGMAVTFSAFTSTTKNDGNQFKAGTVVLSDNDADTALFSLDKLQPGAPMAKCLTVAYDGTLDSKVKLYGTTATSEAAKDLRPLLNVNITRGTGSAADCSDFAPAADGADIYNGKLADLKGTYDDGHADPKTWVEGDEAVYRVTVEVDDTDAAQGKDAQASLTFEARDFVPAP